mgnify:CR=1 FL=1
MSEPKWTPAQRAAIEDRGGALLVSAAAGSGKTKVLVERLFRYITAEHCHVDDFLIITYTKAAAAELRSKISEELSRRLAETPGDRHLRSQLLRVYQADIKTVDAFCTALLRENTHLLAQDGEKHTLTPDFRVLDENDAALLRKRVLGRVLEAFYENMDAGAALLADTLGAGRDDSALENLVLETYEKLQSHASPEAWLERNRTAWTACTGDFDETPYADALLRQVRRKVHHWSQSLLKAASALALDPQKDDLYRGYGEKFIAAAESIAELETSNGWEETRQCLAAVTFPRLTTPKGMKDDAEVLRLKKLWEGAKGAMKKLGTMLDVSGQEAMEDLAAMAPAMLALLKLTADFSEAYRQEKLRMNCADFSDQEHLALRLLLSAPTELGRQTAGRYREIMVDEYQDTNEVQNAIFQAVSREGQNLFTVGDVKQSIYRFRLADPTIFLDKYKRFASAETAKEGKERKILLSQNFRSRKEILDAANFVFANILSTEMGEMEYGEDEMLYECKAKGIFRKDNQKPLVGDNVEITVLDKQEHTGNLIRILPEMIKSPKLTAEWENDLTLISRGQKNVEEFLFEIEKMVTKLVSDNGQPVEEYQKLFSDGRKEIGKCPRCGNKVYVGKRNYYCSGSDCSFTLWKNNRFFESQGKTLDEATVRKLLSEKQVHFKDLVSEKTKRKYEATIKMEVSETGNPKFQLIFPDRKKGKKNEE